MNQAYSIRKRPRRCVDHFLSIMELENYKAEDLTGLLMNLAAFFQEAGCILSKVNELTKIPTNGTLDLWFSSKYA